MEDEEKCVSVVAPSKVREELEIEASDVVEKTDAGHKRVKEPKWPTSWLWQFSVLSVRTFRQSRHIILSKTNLIQTIAISIIASLIWFQTPMTEAGINNIFGLVTNFLSLSHLLFFSILFLLIGCMYLLCSCSSLQHTGDFTLSLVVSLHVS